MHWAREERLYRVYTLCHPLAGCYVGVTSKTLAVRLRQHVARARRRGGALAPCALHRALTAHRQGWAIAALGRPFRSTMAGARHRERLRLAQLRRSSPRLPILNDLDPAFGPCHPRNGAG